MLKYLEGEEPCRVALNLRPHLFDMLDLLASRFEIILFSTAGDCTKPIVEYLDPDHKYFDLIIKSEDEINSVIDLNILLANRKLKNIAVVDSDPSNFCLNFINGVPIPPFKRHDKNDEMLKYLA